MSEKLFDLNIRTEKKQKLSVQVLSITALVFVLLLAFLLIQDYTITRNAYLSSKNEMIYSDLITTRGYIDGIKILPWLLNYWRDHPDELCSSQTEEERKIEGSDEFNDIRIACTNGIQDPAELSPEYQKLIATFMYSVVALNINRVKLGYSKVYLLGILDEHTSCIYLDQDTYETYGGTSEIVPYEASEHPAVETLLKKGVTDKDQALYEIYHDSDASKEYYIAYLPILSEGGEMCMLCIQYDWTDFFGELLRNARHSMFIGLLVILILVGLLVVLLYQKVISPVLKVKNSVQDYMKDKDSNAVVEKMNNVKVRNEIGVLADSFSDLSIEIDRYTNEILALNSEKERIITELSLATSIQSSMLPSVFPAFPDRKEFDIHASMDPAKEVGGDFYDFFFIDEDHLCLVIADVSGKGIPAALFMMASMITLRSFAKKGTAPAEIMMEANNAICKSNKEEMFVTVWLGILEVSTGKLTCVNAGHEYPAVTGADGRFELLKDKHGVVVGALEGIEYNNYEITLSPGSKIFVYTDGVPEATDSNDEQYGTDKMIKALNEKPEASSEEILAIVRRSVDRFVKDAEQFDDLTMLCLEYKGKGHE